MKESIKEFVVSVAPALEAAFIKAFKVFAYIVLSAAITAVGAYVASKPFDPFVMSAVNVALVSAAKAIETLRS